MDGSATTTLPPELYDEVVRGLKDAQGVRYISAIGLVALLCDHIQTLPEEVRLVWRAPASLAKWLFLANRYLVAGSIIAATHSLAGFNGAVYTDRRCAALLSYVASASVISLGIANLLVLTRVLLLWDKNRRVLFILGASYLVGYMLTVGFLIASIVILEPGIQWSPIARACTPTTKTPFFTAVWAGPFLFEITVLSLTVFNAIARPRSETMGLTNTLHQDGILFFLVITSFRIVNIVFTASPYPNRVNYAGFFVWAMVTVILNRLLLHIRSSEIRIAANDKRLAADFAAARRAQENSSDDEDEPDEPRSPDAIVLNGRASPFGIPLPAHHPRGRERMSSHDADVLPTTYVEMHSFYR
ncbi:hypothetical protein PENSPDRAFT_654862 [Peniophora sp. CONT]|nr:hypothetical protein PENSPDRAFT_654862 [Peniophora sp. CONT]